MPVMLNPQSPRGDPHGGDGELDDTTVFLRESVAWQLEGHAIEDEIQQDEEMLDLCFLAESLAEGVDVRDRRYRLRTFASCFLGSDAVDWLMVHSDCTTRKEAVALGNKMQAAGLLSHVTNDHRFQDKPLFFRFKAVGPVLVLHECKSVLTTPRIAPQQRRISMRRSCGRGHRRRMLEKWPQTCLAACWNFSTKTS